MISLKRDYNKRADGTVGILTLPNGRGIETLERLNLGNQPNISCIPEGEYFFVRDHHGRHQWWSILDVKGRTAIEIHEGYKPNHSEGCILMSAKDLQHMLEFFDDDNVKYSLRIYS